MGGMLSEPEVGKHTDEGTMTTAAGLVSYAASAMQGYRVSMEDQHTCVVDFGGLTEHAFFCVYDGHGGAQAAIVAAELMVSTIQEDAQFKVYAASVAADGKGGDMAALAIALETAYIALDAKLRARPDVGDSGSTVCGFVLTPEHIVCAHAGDSRGCLCRRGADGGIVAVPLSHDHKPSDPEEEARIIKAGGFVSQGAMRMGPMRVDGNLAVSRGLGDFCLKDNADLPPPEQKVSCVPIIIDITRAQGSDEFVLLACDGIWDVMSNEEGCAAVREKVAKLGTVADYTLGTVVESLLDQCLELGSKDNMSAIVVTLP
mgnify:CR=1 FL=1